MHGAHVDLPDKARPESAEDQPQRHIGQHPANLHHREALPGGPNGLPGIGDGQQGAADRAAHAGAVQRRTRAHQHAPDQGLPDHCSLELPGDLTGTAGAPETCALGAPRF
ncbi:hypothetical protein D3C87_1729930 [compost metagenome]